MFQRKNLNLGANTPPTRTQQLLRRAALFGAALIMLWVAAQLAPSTSSGEPALGTFETAEADIVKTAAERGQPFNLYKPGNLIALALLLGGIGTAWYLRRRSKLPTNTPAPIQTVAELSLSQNQQLRLISCGGEILLLGVTAGQITLLKSFPEEVFSTEHRQDEVSVTEVPNMPQPGSPPPVPNGTFSQLLRQEVGRYVNFQGAQS